MEFVVEYSIIVEEEKIAAEKAREVQLAQEQKIQAEEDERARTKCTDLEKFFVIARDRKDAVGQDIIVKDKGEVANACQYLVAEADFNIQNSDPEYFKTLEKNAMVTDVGTGPSGRSFRLYDMQEKKMLTEKKYFGELTVASGTLSYFGLSKVKADKKNCKDYDNLMKDFSNANLVVKKIIDLETFLVKETKESNCVAEQ